jgi:ribonucleoside-diphosphate reductase alpha chain
MTGLASGNVLKLNLKKAAKVAVTENRRVAKILGIKSAARVTTVKPEGTSSLVLGSSSGIHAWHSKYYIRRVTVLKNEPIYEYLKNKMPKLIEDSLLDPKNTAYICMPVKAPEGSITRESESAIGLLERVKKVYKDWILPGHISGSNTHNVSTTVTIKPNEWKEVGEWMWTNRNFYSGLSVLPYDMGTYTQTPFEDCTEEVYNKLMQYVNDIDLSEVHEKTDNTNLKDQVACAGGACTI